MTMITYFKKIKRLLQLKVTVVQNWLPKQTSPYLLLKETWNFLKELGGISLLFTVLTFWAFNHNSYIATANSIRADTGANVTLVGVILDDKEKNWGYLQTFVNQSYTSNWNYIAQYYSFECLQKIRIIAANIESANVLITQRQVGNMNLDQETLYTISEQLKPLLEDVMSCQLKSWWQNLFYQLY